MENYAFKTKSERENYVLRSSSKYSIYFICILINLLIGFILSSVFLYNAKNNLSNFFSSDIIFTFPYFIIFNLIINLIFTYSLYKEAIVQRLYKKYYFVEEIGYKSIYSPIMSIFTILVLSVYLLITLINYFNFNETQITNLIILIFVYFLVIPLIAIYYSSWYKKILVFFLDKWESSFYSMMKKIDREIEYTKDNDLPINLFLIKIDDFSNLSLNNKISKNRLIKFIILFIKSNYRSNDLIFIANKAEGIIGYIGRMNEDILKNIENRVKEKSGYNLKYGKKHLEINLSYKKHNLNFNQGNVNAKDIMKEAQTV